MPISDQHSIYVAPFCKFVGALVKLRLLGLLVWRLIFIRGPGISGPFNRSLRPSVIYCFLTQKANRIGCKAIGPRDAWVLPSTGLSSNSILKLPLGLTMTHPRVRVSLDLRSCRTAKVSFAELRRKAKKCWATMTLSSCRKHFGVTAPSSNC